MVTETLTDFEKALLQKLLAGDHPALVNLRAQANTARLVSRENTGVGFSCDFEVPRDAPLVTPANFELNDVDAAIEGLEHGAGFLLFVRDGRITMLEGYSYDEPWPNVIRNAKLRYRREPRELPF
jgi:hypothetical protein